MEILDVGCGNNKRGTIGIDLRKTNSVDILCDGHFLPFKMGVFDEVKALAVLEHVVNPVRVLFEIRCVLKLGGKLTVVVPKDSLSRADFVSDLLSLNFKHFVFRAKLARKGEHKWQFTGDSLQKLLNKLGFKIIKIEEPKTTWVSGRKGKIISKLGIFRSEIWRVDAEKVKI